MTDNKPNSLAESYAQLIATGAKVGVETSNELLVDVFNTVLAEIASSDLSPTRKEASLKTLRRVIELYADKFRG